MNELRYVCPLVTFPITSWDITRKVNFPDGNNLNDIPEPWLSAWMQLSQSHLTGLPSLVLPRLTYPPALVATVFVQAGNNRGLSWGLSREADAAGCSAHAPLALIISFMWTRWLLTASL